MAREKDWYKRYIGAIFNRSKAEDIPLSYIWNEAEKVLKPDEMDEFKPVFDEMMAHGEIIKEGDTYKLIKK